jgi:membrane-associated phospholipid phosphatase
LFDRFLDHQIVSWEISLLGAEPTLFVDRHLTSVATTEILSLCYFTYYLMLPIFLIFLFLKREDGIIREFLAATCLTFFVSYLLFWLYPAEGPRWHLADQYLNPVAGPVFRPMVDFVIDNAAVHGGAMPSSHTGVALVVMLFCFRCYRRAGWLLLPVVAGLAAGAVWGRFHYLSDVVVGAVIGAAAFGVIRRGHTPTAGPARVTTTSEVLRTQDVS